MVYIYIYYMRIYMCVCVRECVCVCKTLLTKPIIIIATITNDYINKQISHHSYNSIT